MNLIKIGNSSLIIDFNAMSDLIIEQPDCDNGTLGEDTETTTFYEKDSVTQTRVTTKKYDKGKEIDVSKYEILKTMIDIVLSYYDEVDDKLGVERIFKNMPIPVKIAFNTLLYYKVLRNIEI